MHQSRFALLCPLAPPHRSWHCCCGESPAGAVVVAGGGVVDEVGVVVNAVVDGMAELAGVMLDELIVDEDAVEVPLSIPCAQLPPVTSQAM